MKKISRAQLVKSLCAMEGKKVQVSVGNVREIIRCLTILEAGYMVSELENGGILYQTSKKGPLRFISLASKRIAIKAALKRKKARKK